MNKFIFYFLFLASSLFVFTACDYVANPLLPQAKTTTGTGTVVSDTNQKVLIEDFTGMACINCPTMATRAEELIAQYGSRVFFMEVNYGGFANPTQNAAPYNVWDAETTVGDAYGNLFVTASGSYPNALVNRRHFPQTLQNIGDSLTLGDSVTNFLSQNSGKPGIYISLATSFNVGTSALTVTATATFLKAYTGNYNLTVVLMQDSIVAPQNDRPAPITNFYHRFALRDNITTSPWGDAIIIGSAAANQSVTKTYAYTIPVSYQSPDNPTKPPIPSKYQQSYVVAYVYDALSTSPTWYQIMQVQQKKIYP